MNSLFTQCYKLLISPSGDEGCRYLYKNSVELFRSHDDKNLKASLPQRNTTLSTTAPKNSTKDDFLPLLLTFQALPSGHKDDPFQDVPSRPELAQSSQNHGN